MKKFRIFRLCEMDVGSLPSFGSLRLKSVRYAGGELCQAEGRLRRAGGLCRQSTRRAHAARYVRRPTAIGISLFSRVRCGEQSTIPASLRAALSRPGGPLSRTVRHSAAPAARCRGPCGTQPIRGTITAAGHALRRLEPQSESIQSSNLSSRPWAWSRGGLSRSSDTAFEGLSGLVALLRARSSSLLKIWNFSDPCRSILPVFSHRKGSLVMSGLDEHSEFFDIFDLNTLKSSQNMIKLCHTLMFQHMEVFCVIYAPLAISRNYDPAGVRQNFLTKNVLRWDTLNAMVFQGTGRSWEHAEIFSRFFKEVLRNEIKVTSNEFKFRVVIQVKLRQIEQIHFVAVHIGVKHCLQKVLFKTATAPLQNKYLRISSPNSNLILPSPSLLSTAAKRLKFLPSPKDCAIPKRDFTNRVSRTLATFDLDRIEPDNGAAQISCHPPAIILFQHKNKKFRKIKKMKNTISDKIKNYLNGCIYWNRPKIENRIGASEKHVYLYIKCVKFHTVEAINSHRGKSFQNSGKSNIQSAGGEMIVNYDHAFDAIGWRPDKYDPLPRLKSEHLLLFFGIGHERKNKSSNVYLGNGGTKETSKYVVAIFVGEDDDVRLAGLPTMPTRMCVSGLADLFWLDKLPEYASDSGSVLFSASPPTVRKLDAQNEQPPVNGHGGGGERERERLVTVKRSGSPPPAPSPSPAPAVPPPQLQIPPQPQPPARKPSPNHFLPVSLPNGVPKVERVSPAPPAGLVPAAMPVAHHRIAPAPGPPPVPTAPSVVPAPVSVSYSRPHSYLSPYPPMAAHVSHVSMAHPQLSLQGPTSVMAPSQSIPPAHAPPVAYHHPPLYAPYNATPYLPPTSHHQGESNAFSLKQMPKPMLQAPSRSPLSLKPSVTSSIGLMSPVTTTSISNMSHHRPDAISSQQQQQLMGGRTHSPRGHSPSSRERDSYSSSVSSLSRGSMGTPSSLASLPPTASVYSTSAPAQPPHHSHHPSVVPSVVQPSVAPAAQSSSLPYKQPSSPWVSSTNPPTASAPARTGLTPHHPFAPPIFPPNPVGAAPPPVSTAPAPPPVAPNPFSAETLFQSTPIIDLPVDQGDLLRRELDSRFLATQDRGPYIRTEMHHHQHQHTHVHQHTTPIIPPPPPGALFSSPIVNKSGKWNAMHVRVAWEIYHHQQKSAGGEAKVSGPLIGKSDFMRPPTHMFGPPPAPHPPPPTHAPHPPPPHPFTAPTHRSVPANAYEHGPPTFPPSLGSSVFGRYPPTGPSFPTALPTFPHAGALHDPWGRMPPRAMAPQGFPAPPSPWGLKPEVIDEREREREKERRESRERDRQRREEKQRHRLAAAAAAAASATSKNAHPFASHPLRFCHLRQFPKRRKLCLADLSITSPQQPQPRRGSNPVRCRRTFRNHRGTHTGTMPCGTIRSWRPSKRKSSGPNSSAPIRERRIRHLWRTSDPRRQVRLRTGYRPPPCRPYPRMRAVSLDSHRKSRVRMFLM
ncbi:unnamed protein product [Nesidiocoris tenuis]|uniref:Uncharacterized protein n=1 Tax=Nesidiocoris tenuis TaxID=355587 RepID=A0A6H5GSN2_9HEMI|nr:unnamed protein product [Nesidiocoris tenuis]